MLENVNDYMSIVIMFVVLLIVGGGCLFFLNLKAIERHIRAEAKYYKYDSNKITQRKGSLMSSESIDEL